MAKGRDNGALLKGFLTIGSIALAYYFYARDQITKDFTKADLVRSDTALDNQIREQFSPPSAIMKRARRFARRVLQPVANISQLKIDVLSWYRAPRTNALVPGAVADSAHLLAQAIDLRGSIYGMRANNVLVTDILRAGVPFTKIILKGGSNINPGSVHLRYTPGDNRRLVLRETLTGYYKLTAADLRKLAA